MIVRKEKQKIKNKSLHIRDKRERLGIFKGFIILTAYWTGPLKGRTGVCHKAQRGNVGKHLSYDFCGKKRVKKGRQAQNWFAMFESGIPMIFIFTLTVISYSLKLSKDSGCLWMIHNLVNGS